MKRLYLVRHGESEMNVTAHWAGTYDTPLTKHGRTQAQVTGKAFKDKGLKIDLIISSPLSRALDTAKGIATEIGYPLDKIVQDERFMERHYGAIEGKPNSEFVKEFTFKGIDNVKGAETVKEQHDRAIKVLNYVKSLPEDNILIVSHGSFGRALRRVVEDIPYHREYDDVHRKEYRIDNAEIVELI